MTNEHTYAKKQAQQSQEQAHYNLRQNFLMNEIFYEAAKCSDIDVLQLFNFDQSTTQNRHQKVFNRGALRFCGGLDILKIDKNSTDL